jgi:dipeptidyl aminopeptidase/acylaminoacyl peptidase
MRAAFHNVKGLLCVGILFYNPLHISCWVETARGGQSAREPEPQLFPSERSEINLAAIPFKIIYETFRVTEGRENWELFLMDADGSNVVNLTRTPDVGEMYPHASPDGTKVCFVADEISGKAKVRNVYYMNIDGTGRVKVSDHAREPCWGPDGNTIAYLGDEYDRYTNRPYGTKGLFFYDTTTASHQQHPNKELLHVYNICWSPERRWFLSSAVGGFGLGNAIVAFEAQGNAMFDLTQYGIKGCRPDLSSDGRMMTWGKSNFDLCVADIDLTLLVPRVARIRDIVKCRKEYYVYHADFSPDGRYIAFSYGPEAGSYNVGVKAPGWNICVGDLTGRWVEVTTDGNHNKEPDWVPIAQTRP